LGSGVTDGYERQGKPYHKIGAITPLLFSHPLSKKVRDYKIISLSIGYFNVLISA
jgi:hypothetical protein